MSEPKIRNFRSHRAALALALPLALLAALAAGAVDWKTSDPALARNHDARDAANAGTLARPSDAQVAAAAALRQSVPELMVSYHPATGATRTLVNPTGYLTGPVGGRTPLEIGLGFVHDHLDLLGLSAADLAGYEVTDDVYTRVTGATHLYLRQTYAGLPLYNGQLQLHVNRDGRLIGVNSDFLPGLAAAVNTLQPAISAATAVARTADQLGIAHTGTPATLAGPAGPAQVTAIDPEGLSSEPIEARLAWLPIRRGEARLVWNFHLVTLDGEHSFDLTTDAVTGQVWTRSDWIASAQYRVYPQPVESPIHTSPLPPADARVLVTDPQDATASPFGWHDTDGVAGAEFTIHRGNNAHAYEDSDANNAPPAVEPDCGGSLVCDFPIDLTMAPSAYRPAAVTNLYYWNNIIHDVQYQYGFDEVGGNFQVNNYGNGGLGNDDVRAEAQDGGGNCNANFGTPADGSRPRMQMFTCTNSSPAHDGDLESMVIVHEYGHGISNRQVGGPANVNCLNNAQQPGEGWSDWFGLVYTAETGDTGATPRGVGTYLFGQAADGPGIRDQRYSTDPAVNTWTYESIMGAAIPHGVGSRWAQGIWEVYWALVDQYGFSTDLYDAAGGAGNQRALLYVNEGLKDTACSPTFLNARDGIIQAAMDNYGGDDVCLIWQAFAGFGLGTDASTPGPGSTTATNGFQIPVACEFLGPTPESQAICTGSDAVYTIGVGSAFTPPVTLSASGHPAGTTATFVPNPVVSVPGSSTFTIGNTAGATPGNYVITVHGTDGGAMADTMVSLDVFDAVPGAATLMTPADGAVDVPTAPTLTWNAAAGASGYLVEIATDAGFTNIVYSANSAATTHVVTSNLAPETEHFWRVTAENPCGAGTASAAFSFTTVNQICQTPNLAIPDNNATGASSNLNVATVGALTDIDVSIVSTHSWVGDVSFTLTHVDSGHSAVVFDRPGQPASTFGCSRNDIDTTLDDGAATSVETVCAVTTPTIDGIFKPSPGALAVFSGEDVNGTWTLKAVDAAGGDTGTLVSWCLLPAATTTDIFADGFESGDLSAWSAVVP